ncbi:alpha/beta-hydrolase [Auriculariales sp. MPI-PUGE-AT-0066]|nr:alpha/beta-hydrolase [Auriculariales sp. MPI-PUGE-AT-0066]
MQLSEFLTLTAVFVGSASAAVTQAVYDQLVNHFKYASSAYPALQPCLHPNGQTLISTFSNSSTDTQGYIARDDTALEFIVAFSGRTTAADNTTFANNALVAYGTGTGGAKVHTGFNAAYNSVKTGIASALTTAVAGAYANYRIVTVGHDIGGSLAVLATLHLRNVFVGNLRATYTYGQPRTGDLQFAFLVDESQGFSVRRVTYKNDGVPKSIPENISSGYVHHPVEYWVTSNTAAGTTQCREYGDAVVGEDENCSLSVATNTWNANHDLYFGIATGTQFCT